MKKGQYSTWTCATCKEKLPANPEYFPLMQDNPNYFRNGHKKCALCLNGRRIDMIQAEEKRHAEKIRRLKEFGRRIRARAEEIRNKHRIGDRK